jgi:uncharacterized protein
MFVLDAFAQIGSSREVELRAVELLASMDTLGIDKTIIAPPSRCFAVAPRAGNEMVMLAAHASMGRLLAYAVASPWLGRDGVKELERAADAGAVGLAVDPAIQGFDLLDHQIDPLLNFAEARRWPVYVRTGTPAFGLPLQLAEVALRYPMSPFIMGKGGATDFWRDARPALERAPNLYADTAYGPWDIILDPLIADPIGPNRVVFTSDQPFADPSIELARIKEWPLDETARAAVLGGTVLSWLS